jgi:hypothetical protein
MKTRWFVVLLALNLALFALCCFLVIRGTSDNSTANLPPAEEMEAAAAPQNTAQQTPSSPHSNDQPAIVIRTNAFHWSQIESSDYRQYITNLRAIGCPEATIKDIILTDIMKLFAERRGQYSVNGREFRYWETDEKRALTARQEAERDKELAKIDKQVPSVLRELLGINYDRELNKYFVDTHEDARRLGFLPEEKRQQLLAAREQIENLREKVFERAEQGEPMDPDSLRQIQDYRREVLAGILTPQEMEEYDLRMSETAERLRANLVGFNPTEDEFREIFRLQREFDEKFARATPEMEAAKAAEQEKLEQEIKSKLDPERFADYERSKDKEYQEMCFFAQKQELPLQVAQTIYDYKQVAERERARVLADQQISEETKMTALRAIEAETIHSMRQAMGDSVFGAYLQGPGTWVQALGTVTPAK